MPVNDVVLNEVAVIARCANRMREEFADDEQTFFLDLAKQDTVVLNFQRACEASLDIANFIIKKNKLGAPQSAINSFDLLEKGKIISLDLSLRMKEMIGLRDLAVYDDQKLNLDMVVAVVRHDLSRFDEFCAKIVT